MNLSHLFLCGLGADNDLSFVREFDPCGVILMGRNVRPISEVRALCAQLGGRIIASDHEGGRVQRLTDGFTILPPAREWSQATNELAHQVGRELKGAGLNLNFAPVCDVPTHEGDTVIATRAFSSDFSRASERVTAYTEALQAQRVGACAKHFPGHGGVGVDSHVGLPTFAGSRAEIEPHLRPFRAAIEAGVAAIMVGHIAVASLDPSNAPASLSKPIVSGLLRSELGFNGLIVTDDLEMGALSSLGAGEIAVRALEAGCDLLLFCHSNAQVVEARDAVERALETERLSHHRVEDALERSEKFRQRFC